MYNKGVNIYFGEKTLHGYSYVTFFSNLTEIQKHQLSCKINKFGGRITFALSPATIAIIGTKNDLRISKLINEIKNYEKVSLYIDNNIEIIKTGRDKENIDSNANKDHLRIITYQDLSKVIEIFEDSNIETHIDKGLPKGIDKKAVISFVYPKESRERLHYQVFDKLKDEYIYNNLKKNEYDFPQYIRGSPLGYSLWMTLEEYESVCLLNKKTKPIKNVDELSKPRKENNFCQMCNTSFEDYDLHIKSSVHIKSIQNSNQIFINMNKNFEEIRNYIMTNQYLCNKDEIIKKENINTQPQIKLSTHKKRSYKELNYIEDDINRIKQFKTKKCKKLFKDNINYIKTMKKGVDNINGFINYN